MTTMGDLKKLVPAFGAGILVGYMTYKWLGPDRKTLTLPESACAKCINPAINKDLPKVYNEINVEDLGGKTNFCRCWRSKKFPLCDGSHNKFNEENGDNVAALVVYKGLKSIA